MTADVEVDLLGNRASMSRWWNRVRRTLEPLLAVGLLDEDAEVEANEEDGGLETITFGIICYVGRFGIVVGIGPY